MSDEQRQPGDVESTNTADVRDAIARAREATEQQDQAAAYAQTPEQFNEQAPVASPIEPAPHYEQPSGYTAEQHVSINTERMPIQEQQEMPSAGDPAHMHQPTTPFHTQEQAQPFVAQDAGQQVQHVQPMQPMHEMQQPQQQPMTISPDHPMAPLYFQQPNPPTLRSNRLAGVLISLLATLAFAVLYAGVLALWLMPSYPPSRFVNEGILPYLTSLGFILPIVAFFVGMVILVLIFNRAGWWVYVIFGIVVAALVWGTAGAGYSLSPELAAADDLATEYGLSLEHILSFALTIPGIMAALAAREVAVWFGAWIGARGRKAKKRNAEAMQEYDAKLQELQAPQHA